MKKIKAFTLTEILVVMVISTIVVSLAFMVLGMVQKQIKIIQNHKNIKENIKQVEKLIWKDVNEFNYAYLKSKSEMYFCNEIDTIYYKITDNFIVRGIDTLLLPIKHEDFFLDGEKISIGAFDAIKITFEEPYTRSNVFAFGVKDASFYVNK